MKKIIINSFLLIAYLLTINNYLLTITYADEEQSVYNLNEHLLPQEVAQYAEPQNILQQIISFIQFRINSIFIAQSFREPGNFYTQSENVGQTSVPDSVKPDNKANFLNNLKGFLGRNTGFYGVELPDFGNRPTLEQDRVDSYEKAYEQANFPDGIRPITGQ